MPDVGPIPDFIRAAMRNVVQGGEGAPSPERKEELAYLIRDHSPEASRELDRFLIERNASLRKGLDEATESLDQAKEIMETLTSPPLYPAVFIKSTTAGGAEALVNVGGDPVVVRSINEVDISDLGLGDAVLLGPEKNVIVGLAHVSMFETGETAVFDRHLGDDRGVVRSRGEDVVVRLQGGLEEGTVRSGDLVRWNQRFQIAQERLERSEGTSLFIEETPTETFDDIGGLDTQIQEIMEEVGLRLEHPDVVRKYKLRPASSILVVGPPGGGKTLLARALANRLAARSAAGRARFMNIKPGGLSSSWYGQTEENIREAFRVAAEAGREDPDVPVVMFFDEVDSIAAARGASYMRVDDRVTGAFLAELNGFESRGNVIVVAATNRRDALDAAAIREGRLGDLVLEVPRPDRAGTRAILGKHLHEDLPYAPSPVGTTGSDARDELLEAVTSRVFAPNGLGELARIAFRDGKTRALEGRDLMSGALLANVARIASKTSGLRDARTGDEGIRQSDVLEAMEAELEKAVRTLTPNNCHRFIDDLPQDVDVVRVEPIERRVRMATRYLTVA